MDNCGGQNEKKALICLGAYLRKVGYFKKENFMFLVKGHTKKSAYKMINLFNYSWHKM